MKKTNVFKQELPMTPMAYRRQNHARTTYYSVKATKESKPDPVTLKALQVWHIVFTRSCSFCKFAGFVK